jgi:hypothetical protein
MVLLLINVIGRYTSNSIASYKAFRLVFSRRFLIIIYTSYSFLSLPYTISYILLLISIISTIVVLTSTTS